MNLLNYSLVAVIAYMGLFIGFILAIIAKEEMKAGKKYFILLQKVILPLIFVFLMIYMRLTYTTAFLILAYLVIVTLKKKGFKIVPYIYIMLAIIFFLSERIFTLFIIESSLIFLYGLPTGSLLTKKSKKETIISLLKNIPFVVIAIILFLIL